MPLKQDSFPTMQDIQNTLPAIQHKLDELIEKARRTKSTRLEPEVLRKLAEAQILMEKISSLVKDKVEGVVRDYSFLYRDHVFFDGDHQNHSGAV